MIDPLMIRVPDEWPIDFGPAPQPLVTRDREPQAVQWVVGVDLGQSRDFTAIVINRLSLIEREHCNPDVWANVVRRETIVLHHVRHIERVPLGTSYPDVVEIVRHRVTGLPKMPREPQLVVDATGVGRPVLDLMRRAGLDPFGVTITGGGGETVEKRDARVAKRLLANTIAVALDTGRLTFPAPGDHRDTLRRELSAFRVTVNANQNETFEAWREKDHDDLVLGCALAVWWGNRQGPRFEVNPNFRLVRV